MATVGESLREKPVMLRKTVFKYGRVGGVFSSTKFWAIFSKTGDSLAKIGRASCGGRELWDGKTSMGGEAYEEKRRGELS